jgi:hypothetical protein
MRFVKFILILMMAFAAGVSFAQSQAEISMNAERESTSLPVHIFPNPAVNVDYVHVKIEDLTADKVVLAVHNILGNEMSVEKEIVNDHELRVYIKDLATGYYFLAIKDDESKYRRTFKFLKR